MTDRSRAISQSGQTQFSIPEALQLAHAHWVAGQTDQAEMLCQRVLAVWPGQTDALHMMGLMAHGFGNLDLAISHLRQACQAPRAPAVYFSNLAEMLRQQGGLQEAEQAARRATALNNGLPGAWNNLGIILQELGKLEESRICLERMLALEPNSAEGHNNLANTCKRAGKLDEAARHWARALELNPEYAEPYSNLSNWLNEQGEHESAARHARRAIELNPQMADAYINLAAIETSRGRHGEALRWLNALLAFAPVHASGLAARALTFKHLERPDEALQSAQAAVAAGPENAEAVVALGLVLQSQGRPEEALATYERAALLPGAVAEKALINRAIVFMELGQATDARQEFDRALATFPRSASAMFNSADLQTFRSDDPAIAEMQALLAPGGLQSPADQMLLHFALGKAFLDIGESDQAFHHLNHGNRMKRRTVVYDAAATSTWMSQIAAAFSPDFMAAHAGGGAGSAMPIFVLGMPRSGTSLVEQVLASHPAIAGAGELNVVLQFVERSGNYPSGVPMLAADAFRSFGEAYAARVHPLAAGKAHVIDKMPANFLYAGLIHLMLPNARIIHCRRDPVDTCLSCYSKLFANEQSFAYDMAELGIFHRDYQKLMAHWRKVLPATRFLDVDYEAVIDDLETQVRRLLSFLGLPWHPACLEFHRTQRVIRTASVNQVRQPIYRSSTGRWRNTQKTCDPCLRLWASQSHDRDCSGHPSRMTATALDIAIA